MDALVGVWLTSVLGAGAFSAAGYVLGQRGVVVPGLFLPPPLAPVALPPPPPVKSSPARAPDSEPPLELTVVHAYAGEPMPGDPTPTPPAFPAAAAAALPAARPSVPPLAADDNDDVIERSTVVRKRSDHAALLAAAGGTIPPPRPASIRVGGVFNEAESRRLERDLTTARQELREARERAEKATAQAHAAEARNRELERQVDALRSDLRQEVAARATATARAEELGDRLATASEDAAGLRHKVSNLDKQTKQLREALQGRVRALTTSEWHRRREIEDAEEVQKKLRDVYEKLERSSLPPPSGTSPPPPVERVPTAPTAPTAPPPLPPARPREDSELTRLRDENRALRAKAIAALPSKPRPSARGSAPEIDLQLYRTVLDRLGAVPGVRGVVVADELGSLVVGSGDLAEGLAAFGAYIRDASARTEGLLPLDVVDEIALKDRAGATLSTRLIAAHPFELSLVLLGTADDAISAASRVIEQHLRDRI